MPKPNYKDLGEGPCGSYHTWDAYGTPVRGAADPGARGGGVKSCLRASNILSHNRQHKRPRTISETEVLRLRMHACMTGTWPVSQQYRTHRGRGQSISRSHNMGTHYHRTKHFYMSFFVMCVCARSARCVCARVARDENWPFSAAPEYWSTGSP